MTVLLVQLSLRNLLRQKRRNVLLGTAMAIGVMIFNMMRLPRLFPRFRFIMSYTEPTGSATKIDEAAVK